MPELPPRAEHLAWAKARAMAYVDRRDLTNAYASLASDLGHHPETTGHLGIYLGMAELMAGRLTTPWAMRDFIEGFS